MLSKILASGLALLGGGLAVLPAQANVVTLGWNLTGQGTPVTQLATVGTPGAANYTAPPSAILDGYSGNSVNGSDFSPLTLESTTLNSASGGTEPIFIYISETGISLNNPTATFTSQLVANLLTPGWTVNEWVYENSDNSKFGTTTQIATASFTAVGSNPVVKPLSGLAFPFSVTAVYEIIPGTESGQALATISVAASTSTIPEPSTWAMMLIGFAGLGFAGWRATGRPTFPGLLRRPIARR